MLPLDAETTMLLVPGMLCDADLWAGVAPALEEQDLGYRVLDVTRGRTIDELATQALALAPGPLVVAGLSMGCYVALAMVRMAPGRIRALALLSGSSRPDARATVARRRAFLDSVAHEGFEPFVDRLPALFLPPSRLDDDVLTERVRAMAHRTGPEGFRRQQQAVLARPDERAVLSRVDCPTLLLTGALDRLTPPGVGRELADAVPGAEHVVVDGSGHLVAMEDPVSVSTSIATWLAGTGVLTGP